MSNRNNNTPSNTNNNLGLRLVSQLTQYIMMDKQGAYPAHHAMVANEWNVFPCRYATLVGLSERVAYCF